MEKVLVVKTEKLAKFISGKTGLLRDDREEMLDIISDELMPEIPLPKHT